MFQAYYNDHMDSNNPTDDDRFPTLTTDDFEQFKKTFQQVEILQLVPTTGHIPCQDFN